MIIPRILPKPDLMPLTGGYRKTPVLQIGADIYCDTQLILREIERRAPEPTLYPSQTRGLADALGWWAERSLFGTAVAVLFAKVGSALPQAFIEDRSKFSGREFNPQAMKAAEPRMLDASAPSSTGSRQASPTASRSSSANILRPLIAASIIWCGS